MLKISTIFRNKMLLLIAVFVLIAAEKSYSSIPSAPIWLNYSNVTLNSVENTFSVELEWRHGEVNNNIPMPDSYNIYKILVGQSEDKLKLVATIQHNSNIEMQKYKEENIKIQGVYYYYVTSLKDGIESEKSERVSAALPGSYCVNLNAEIIDFTSNPNTIGLPGETYEYTAFAKHRSPRVQGFVRYALVEGPEGMEIDNQTGLLSWDIPINTENEYHIKIKATSDEDKNALSEQEWYLRIATIAEIQIKSSIEDAVKELSLYPIPATSNINIDFNSDYYSNNFELFDNIGNLVYSTNFKTNLGFNSFNLDISNFVNGIYTLKISNDSGISTRKIVIKK